MMTTTEKQRIVEKLEEVGKMIQETLDEQKNKENLTILLNQVITEVQGIDTQDEV